MFQHEEPVFDMCFRGNFGVLKSLLDKHKLLVTLTDSEDKMLIHWATLGEHHHIVKYLISIGSPVDPQDNKKVTPLMCATRAGFQDIAETLIAEGANVNAQTIDGISVLHEACRRNLKKICIMLVQKSVNINVTDKRDTTPLHRAAAKGNLDALRVLLAQKSLNIDAQNKYGNTALHFACHNECPQTAKLLVAHGASLRLTNDKDQTPLEVASESLAQQLKSRVKK